MNPSNVAIAALMRESATTSRLLAVLTRKHQLDAPIVADVLMDRIRRMAGPVEVPYDVLVFCRMIRRLRVPPASVARVLDDLAAAIDRRAGEMEVAE